MKKPSEKSANLQEQETEKDYDYVLYLTKEQAEIISQSTDLLSRLHMGQLTEIVNGIYDYNNAHNGHEDHQSVRRALCESLEAMRSSWTGLDSNSYHSMGSHKIHPRARIACDIHQVLRKQLYLDQNQNGNDGFKRVTLDDPFHFAKETPLPTFKRQDKIKKNS